MADISKCSGEGCAKKLLCYRYTAPSGFWQSWAEFEPDAVTGKCDDYWPNVVANPNNLRIYTK
jgi:hypothetical protein